LKRDIELERKILIKVEETYKPGDNWISIEIDGREKKVVAEHCKFLFQQGLLADFRGTRDLGGLRVQNLTAKGYDYLEIIRNEKNWKEIKKTADKNNIPKTIENFSILSAKMVGAFAKEFFDVP